MKIIILSLVLFSPFSYADVKWDVPVEKFSEYTDTIYIMNLTVGDTARIDIQSVFCTTKNGDLALNGTTEVGSGTIKVKMLPGKKVTIEAPDTNELIKELVLGESYAPCDWWTAHKGKYIYIVDTINGKSSISSLYKKP